VNATKSRQNRFNQTFPVGNVDEKAGRVNKDFDASPQSRLRVNGEFVCVLQYDYFKRIFAGKIRLSKEFQVFADEFDALELGAVNVQREFLDACRVVLVDFTNELMDEGAFATPNGPVKQDIGYVFRLVKIV
jgi:hypothetical protein